MKFRRKLRKSTPMIIIGQLWWMMPLPRPRIKSFERSSFTSKSSWACQISSEKQGWKLCPKEKLKTSTHKGLNSWRSRTSREKRSLQFKLLTQTPWKRATEEIHLLRTENLSRKRKKRFRSQIWILKIHLMKFLKKVTIQQAWQVEELAVRTPSTFRCPWVIKHLMLAGPQHLRESIVTKLQASYSTIKEANHQTQPKATFTADLSETRLKQNQPSQRLKRSSTKSNSSITAKIFSLGPKESNKTLMTWLNNKIMSSSQ